MEEYKNHLINRIYGFSETLEEVENSIKDKPNVIVNRNEEGKIHSRYLGDRYEPAIIKYGAVHEYHYYLFDGDIKDCIHPFRILYTNKNIDDVIYYSSERIKNGEPIYIDRTNFIYNQYLGKSILHGYESKQVCFRYSNYLEEFTLLCDEMEKPFAFKFAD